MFASSEIMVSLPIRIWCRPMGPRRAVGAQHPRVSRRVALLSTPTFCLPAGASTTR
jgi:hypothetical protein